MDLQRFRWFPIGWILLLAAGCGGPGEGGEAPPGSGGNPLRVMLVPADGGTESGTLADYEPIFNAVARSTGLRFDIKTGQSYNAVVEGMVAGKVDIAFFGPVTFDQAKRRGAAELLAVAVTDGESAYYSGIFVRKDGGIESLEDLRGKSIAFGDVNSTSSFNVPLAMIVEAGIDPINGLGEVIIAGSHASSLAALQAGKVDAACASYTSFEKAAENGQVNPEAIAPIAKSAPIPYPPIAMHVNLDPGLKETLREAFHTVHEQPDIPPEAIRGYGGKRVDRYDARFPAGRFDEAMERLSAVTDDLKAALLKKAGGRRGGGGE